MDRFHKWKHMLWSNTQLPSQAAHVLVTNDTHNIAQKQTDVAEAQTMVYYIGTWFYWAFTVRSNRRFVRDEDLCGWNVLGLFIGANMNAQ